MLDPCRTPAGLGPSKPVMGRRPAERVCARRSGPRGVTRWTRRTAPTLGMAATIARIARCGRTLPGLRAMLLTCKSFTVTSPLRNLMAVQKALKHGSFAMGGTRRCM